MDKKGTEQPAIIAKGGKAWATKELDTKNHYLYIMKLKMVKYMKK